MFNFNENEMGMDKIVYAPNYMGSNNGILEIEEDKEYALDSYLAFDGIEFKSIEDVKEHIRNILEKFTKVYYNIYIEESIKYDIIHISYNRGYIRIYIPHKTQETDIEQEYLYKTIMHNGCFLAERQPFRHFDSLNFEFRNMF